jgi:hypothetical protein
VGATRKKNTFFKESLLFSKIASLLIFSPSSPSDSATRLIPEGELADFFSEKISGGRVKNKVLLSSSKKNIFFLETKSTLQPKKYVLK